MPSPEHISGRTCLVRLMDRRTGAPLRVNGSVLALFTRDPDDAVRELMAGRDRAQWEPRIDPLGSPQA
ncbi:hypothetical protein ACXN5S_06685 [Pseudoroseicyclus sp. H15]